MKIHELLEHEDDRWYRRDTEHFGLRVGVTREQVTEIVRRIKEMIAPGDPNDMETLAVIWTSPRHARTFPADIRMVITQNDPRFDPHSEDGRDVVWFFKLAIKRAVKEVLDIQCEVNSIEEWLGNGMRYIDTTVGWAT